ncbi:MAG: GNAT family N-acetyltransferase [Actinomycetota bacterium]|nr:GNAT family N-acetyltransferase [Actinomycetota bacterium]
MGIEIQELHPPTEPDPVLLELHDYYVELDRERLPDDPPMPAEQRLAMWRNVNEHLDIRRWVLREDGVIVAAAVVAMDQVDDINNAFARVHVRPSHRRQGHALALARPVLDAMTASGRKSVITDTLDGAPWESKLAKIGMKKSLTAKESRLLVDEVDWDFMDEWITRAAERASDYELLSLEAPFPEEHLQNWCDVLLHMNSAPREDLEFEDFTMSPEKWRDIETKDLNQGVRVMAEVAIHKPTGAWVGLSEIASLDHQPDTGWQGDTGVDPVHRNKGLGRWLKAAMLRRFVEAHPSVERIDTENAASNEAMLNINVEMGYRPLFVNNAWQGDLDDIRSALGL